MNTYKSMSQNSQRNKKILTMLFIFVVIFAGFFLLKKYAQREEGLIITDEMDLDKMEECNKNLQKPVDIIWEGRVYGYVLNNKCLIVQRTRWTVDGVDYYDSPPFIACSEDSFQKDFYKERVRIIGKWTQITDMYAGTFFKEKCSPYIKIEKIEPIECPKIELTGDIVNGITDQSLKDLIIQDTIWEPSSIYGPKFKAGTEDNFCRSDSLWVHRGEKIDLNNDGISEYIIFPTAFYEGEEKIMSLRGASGNGNILIYGFIDQTWKLIAPLDGKNIRISKKSITNGYFNLITDYGMGYHTLHIYEYAWNGKEYEMIDEIFLEERDKSSEEFMQILQEIWDSK